MYKITCKQCRRLGQSICGKENCAIRRKPYRPGQRSRKTRTRISEYGRQLIEKQKLRLLYGLREKQFRNYFTKAAQKKEGTGQALVSLLERRLDNVVFRLGFATTRSHARQMVGHGHFLVNKRKVSIPSYLVKKGDIIAIKESSLDEKKLFEDTRIKLKKYETPSWLELDKEKLEGKVISLPDSEVSQDIPVEITQVVEYYSR